MIGFGLRNLFRSTPRLAIVAVLIGLPFFLFLVMQTIGAAMNAQTELLKRSVDNALQLRARGSMGHVNMVGNEDILPQDALEKVRSIPHVARVEPYLLAMTPTAGHNFAMIVGVNPGDTRRLESHGEAGSPRIIAGRDLTEEDRGKRVAIIGQGYAKWAGITSETLEGATLTLDLTRTHPVIFALKRPSATLKIVGIYASGYVFGDMQLFMPFDTFREIYGVEQGISWLFVRADSTDHLRAVEKELRTLLGNVADIIAPTAVAEFQSKTTRAVAALAQAGAWLAAALMLIVLFFVMLLTVRQRAREIGTLKALGAADGAIVSAFLAEAAALCLAGALAGAALFALWGARASERLFGLGIAPFLSPEYKDTLQANLSFSPELGASGVVLMAVMWLLVAAGGSAWGVRQIIRLSPMEAIRDE